MIERPHGHRKYQNTDNTKIGIKRKTLRSQTHLESSTHNK